MSLRALKTCYTAAGWPYAQPGHRSRGILRIACNSALAKTAHQGNDGSWGQRAFVFVFFFLFFTFFSSSPSLFFSYPAARFDVLSIPTHYRCKWSCQPCEPSGSPMLLRNHCHPCFHSAALAGLQEDRLWCSAHTTTLSCPRARARARMLGMRAGSFPAPVRLSAEVTPDTFVCAMLLLRRRRCIQNTNARRHGYQTTAMLSIYTPSHHAYHGGMPGFPRPHMLELSDHLTQPFLFFFLLLICRCLFTEFRAVQRRLIVNGLANMGYLSRLAHNVSQTWVQMYQGSVVSGEREKKNCLVHKG